MTTRATATFETVNWDESPFSEIAGGPKLTRALVTGTYSGDLHGQTTVAFIMVYPDEATANFSGLERIEGQLGSRSGSFVLRHEGSFAGGEAKTTLTIVPGSGTGELAGLRGDGTSLAPAGTKAELTLDYDLA
ncbi:MAG TPA: DUF3224 domain-containing protein [Thermomicrobiales bacterium]|jgi:hypothetical protein